MKADAEEPSACDEARRATRSRPVRWKVVARVQPQGDAGVRWVHLTYAREEPEDWPYRRGRRST